MASPRLNVTLGSRNSCAIRNATGNEKPNSRTSNNLPSVDVKTLKTYAEEHFPEGGFALKCNTRKKKSLSNCYKCPTAQTPKNSSFQDQDT